MNTSNTLRSHLIQQFVNHARNQSRTPPIALSSWLRMNDNNDPNDENEMNDLKNESFTTSQSTTTTTIPSEAKTQMTHSNRVLSNRLSSSSQQQQQQHQLQRLLSTYSYSSNNNNNDDDKNDNNNNPNIIDTLSSVLLSSPVMDPRDGISNSIPVNLPQSLSSLPQSQSQQQSLSPLDRTSSQSQSQQPQQSGFHLPNSDHDTLSSSIRTMTPTELSLAFQTIMSTRHTTNHFRRAITTGNTTNTTNTTENETNHPMEHTTSTVLLPPPPPVVWYTKYDYEMAIIRAVRVGFTAPNHKRTEPYIFQRILSDTTIERLADIAAKVYYYQQMNKLLLLLPKPSIIMNDNYGDDTRSLESPYEQQRQQIIKSMEKKREKWRNIPAYLVTLLVSKSKTTKTEVTLSDSSLVGITKMTDHNSSSNMKSNQKFGINNEQTGNSPHTTTSTAIANMETTTITKNENDTTNPSTNPDAYWYRPRPFRPIVSEQDCEDYAAACAATQNVLLSLHSEQMATKWVTGPITQTPAFHQLLQLPLDETDDVSSSSQPQHRVVALIMIGQAADHENDETTNTTTTTTTTTSQSASPPSTAAMDYFHRLHHQQQRRIPKRRTFQDLLQDL